MKKWKFKEAFTPNWNGQKVYVWSDGKGNEIRCVADDFWLNRASFWLWPVNGQVRRA